jgi:hypothetical protein
MRMLKMSMNKLRSSKIEYQDSLSFFYERLMPRMSSLDNKKSLDLFELGRTHLLKAQKNFNKASSGDADILNAADDLIWSIMLLANFFPPLDEELLAIRHEITESVRRESTVSARKSRSDEKAARQKLLQSTYKDLTLYNKRKNCEAIKSEFGKICEAAGIKAVDPKTLHSDVKEILSERQNNS